jgi:hypothetical protein
LSPMSLKLCRERFIAYNPEFNNTVRFVVGDAEKLSTILSDDVTWARTTKSVGVVTGLRLFRTADRRHSR